MDQPKTSFFKVFGILKSIIPWRSDQTNVSRVFWMPDDSCRVCYECDAQFTLFNRRHHCRLCGLIFCAKCTENSVPVPSNDPANGREEWERIRVCHFCFNEWELGLAAVDNVVNDSGSNVYSSPSAESFSSTKSSETAFRSIVNASSLSCSVGQCEQVSEYSSPSPYQSAVLEQCADMQAVDGSVRSNIPSTDMETHDSSKFVSTTNRSSDEDDDDDEDNCGVYMPTCSSRNSSETNYYSQVEFSGVQNGYITHELHSSGERNYPRDSNNSSFQDIYSPQGPYTIEEIERKEGDLFIGEECEAPSSLCAAADVDTEPVDFENNGLLWVPPEPENEEDEREAALFDDDDGDGFGEWDCMRSSGSYGSGDQCFKERCNEEHKKAMKSIVDGHFRALVSQLLVVENITVEEEDEKENWLEIITSLSWEAATLLKPDMSRGGGMDPGGYVKIKCIACGLRSDSTIVRGVVCKKNVAHRRMAARIEKPRLLILGGALEYQRVTNHLSSFDTLLQQEMDHLKMAVAKIDAQHPNVLLVEKSVSRFAQEYILGKSISLVLNIKRPLLERIARCTGAQIVPSVDHLSAPKLGYCDSFHVEKFLEEHGSAGQSGKKLAKNLMFFEGCPKPLGCTILLRGATVDELKKVKHVVQYGVFAAYHLALETSFLADEGASLPDLALNDPFTVALPDKSLSIDRSISTYPCFSIPTIEKRDLIGDSEMANGSFTPITSLSGHLASIYNMEFAKSCSMDVKSSLYYSRMPCFSQRPAYFNGVASIIEADDSTQVSGCLWENKSAANDDKSVADYLPASHKSVPQYERTSEALAESIDQSKHAISGTEVAASQPMSLQQDGNDNKEPISSKEEFPPSSDHQSILVSLSSRCVWKGTVCERAHLLRIKYYGSFDKPLGRFLQDHLFDENFQCHSCEMPSEAHVQCYTHRQGTLTISVRKLPEVILPGQREGKIWMWHRCLRCPRMNDFPPATRRVIMSDAAWGLSFGKFLELSFSNHAAASRVASCGHSLHRDCLRFYGSGKMVACFRYASIDVLSVYLPPSKLDFNCGCQEWIKKEADEVVGRADMLFTEVLNALYQIEGKKSGEVLVNDGMRSPSSRCNISKLEGALQNKKAQFEETLRKTLNQEETENRPVMDLLEINRLRLQLLLQSYRWDQQLVSAASSDKTSLGNPGDFIEMLSGLSDSFHSGHPLSVNPKLRASSDQSGEVSTAKQSEAGHKISEGSFDLNQMKEDVDGPSAYTSFCEPSDPLESGIAVRRAVSDSEFSFMTNLSDTLDAAWTGKSQSGLGLVKDTEPSLVSSNSVDSSFAAVAERLPQVEERGGIRSSPSLSPEPNLNSKVSDNREDTISWFGMPFLNVYRSLNRNFLGGTQKLDNIGDYNPVYVSSFRASELQSGARFILTASINEINEIVIPVYDDEPTSVISHALVSQDYHIQLSDEGERAREAFESALSLPSHDSSNFASFQSLDESSYRSFGPGDDSIASIQASHSFVSDSPSLPKSPHIRVSFSYADRLEKVRYTVTCYNAKQFDALRKMCCPSELDFVRSLSRCKKWGAQGGKSNVFFAKTLDDRFIIKQVTKTELESFLKFAPAYFNYLMEAITMKSPTCLAKVFGIYQVTTKYMKGGKESKMDVLVMENLLFRRKVTRLYDLKGSTRSRYNPDSSGSNKVLLDQNLIECMPTSPIFVGNKAKRLLERAVWNDTAFLASVDVMDYSLLVGVDEENHELVLGIIDFMRQYTWDKHLETWVKASGILGGPKNVSPTVISPKQYKKRFRKAMTTYFLMVPDQWSPLTITPSKSQNDLSEENTQTGVV